MIEQSKDFVRVFSENRNYRLISVRLLGAVANLCVLICAILYMHSAVPMHQTLKAAVVLVITVLGIYQLVDYYYMSVFLRDRGMLTGAVLNTMISMLPLFSPVGVTVSVFAYMFGFLLMVPGANKITFANKLYFFDIFDYSWMIASGIMSILAAAIFLIIPLISIVMLNTVLAGHLIVGGITLLVEVVTMKDMKIEDVQE